MDDILADALIVGSPSGWWLRIADHDDIFYKTKREAVEALMRII
jgi:hypothetical protein